MIIVIIVKIMMIIITIIMIIIITIIMIITKNVNNYDVIIMNDIK